MAYQYNLWISVGRRMNFSDFNNKDIKLGFIGLGLIGGSLAKAFREALPHSTIVCYNRREEPRKMAIMDGTADIVTKEVDNSFADCDYIFLCTPVEFNEMYLKKLKTIIKPECIITDAGSTKTNIHEAVTTEGMEANFIGGHPMAGSEKTGYEFSNAWLFKNAYYVITPTGVTAREKLEEFKLMVRLIGAKPIVIGDYTRHDYAVAGISHLPHIIAAELTNLVKDMDTEDNLMKTLAANGFKDSTRIAASSPEMWQQICMTNTENITMLLDEYIKRLTEVKEKITGGDGEYVYNLFTRSRQYRNEFGNKLSGNPNDL